MVLEEMLRQEHRDGYEEGLEQGRVEILRENIRDILNELGEIPPELSTFLNEQDETDALKKLFSIARRSTSLEDFEKKVR